MLRHACLSCRHVLYSAHIVDAVETVSVSYAACSLLKLAVKGLPSLSFTAGRHLSSSTSAAIADGIAIDDTAVQVGTLLQQCSVIWIMIAGQNISRATCLELWGPLVQVVKHIGLQLAIVLHV